LKLKFLNLALAAMVEGAYRSSMVLLSKSCWPA